MRGQFRVQRTLQNRLGQLLQKTVLPGYLFHRRTPLQQLIDQLPIQSHSISSQLVEKIVYTIWFTPSRTTARAGWETVYFHGLGAIKPRRGWGTQAGFGWLRRGDRTCNGNGEDEVTAIANGVMGQVAVCFATIVKA